MKRSFVIFFFLVVSCSSSSTPDNVVQNDVCDAVLGDGVTFSSGHVTVENISIEVEIADTAAERSQGLMCRESVASGTGMLFLFSSDQTSGFWMKNTYVALDIAYIDADGVIVDIREMRPCTALLDSEGHVIGEWPDFPEQCLDDQENYNGGTYPAGSTPQASYRSALEVPQGYFQANSVAVGDSVLQE